MTSTASAVSAASTAQGESPAAAAAANVPNDQREPRAGSREPAWAAARAALDAAAQELATRTAPDAAPITPADRERLKATLVTLLRAAEGERRAWTQLVDDAKALAPLWKQLTVDAEPPNAALPISGETSAAIATSGTSRTDHLGASTYIAKGWSAYAIGDFEAAEHAFARALTLAPGEPEALGLHGWVLAALGRDDDALLAAQRLLAADARHPAAALARVTIGRVCLAKGIVGEALEHLSGVVRDAADRRATLYATFYLGAAYLQREMYDDAIRFLRRTLTLGPNLVEAHHALGRAYWRAGARDAACEAWRTGAASGNFTPWATRCHELLAHVEQGGSPP